MMNTIITSKKQKKMDSKYITKKLCIKGYDYSVWTKNKEKSIDEEESTNKKEWSDKEESVAFSDMPPLGGDEEEVKEGKGLKILTPNRLLTRLPILLAQIKAVNNPCKLKNEIRQILYLLYQHNKISKKVYNNLIKSL